MTSQVSKCLFKGDTKLDLRDQLCEYIRKNGARDEMKHQIDSIIRTDNDVNLHLLLKYNELTDPKPLSDPTPSVFRLLFNVDNLKNYYIWLRLCVVILSMTSVIVLGTSNVAFITTYQPQDSFNRVFCHHNVLSGKFDTFGYTIVHAIGIAVFIVNLFYFARHMGCRLKDVDRDPLLTIKCNVRFRFTAWFVSVLDVVMILLTSVSCLSASIMLESYKRFSVSTLQHVTNGYNCTPLKKLDIVTTTRDYFYTISTFYDTFSKDDNCLDSDDNPSPKIRAALAMLYLALIPLGFIVWVNFNTLFDWENTLISVNDDKQVGVSLLTNNVDDVEVNDVANPLSVVTPNVSNENTLVRKALYDSIMKCGNAVDMRLAIDSVFASCDNNNPKSESAVTLLLLHKYIELKQINLSAPTTVKSSTIYNYRILLLRIVISVLSLMSVILIRLSRVTLNIRYFPQAFIDDDLCENMFYGKFDGMPYQYVLIVGIVICPFNFGYVLFVGIVPYVSNLFSRFTGEYITFRVSIRFYRWNRQIKFLTIFLDVVMCCVTLAASLYASMALESASNFKSTSVVIPDGCYYPFHFENYGYFTISTYFRSFQSCYRDDRYNPIPKIRASLAMLYLTVFILAWSAAVNYHIYRREKVNEVFETQHKVEEVEEVGISMIQIETEKIL